MSIAESNKGKRELSYKRRLPNGAFYKTNGFEEFTADNIFVNHNANRSIYLDVTGYGYVHVEGECFGEFDKIEGIAADGNRLRLSTMRTFKSLKSLSLRDNQLESIEPIGSELADTLTHLDLSENALGPDDLLRLSTCQLLQSLTFRANGLQTIPEGIADDPCFLSLTRLDLSDNYLTDSRAVYLLSTLHNLQHLLMSNNRLTFVPYLVTEQSRQVHCKSPDGHDNDTDGRGGDGQEETQPTVYGEETEYANQFIYHVSHVPFVSLTDLDLSGNLIDRPSSALSLMCWPSLKNIIMTANPVSSNRNSFEFDILKETFESYDVQLKR
ncbi:uncharacterized protein LOC126848022 [Adelges cooleyi]|uniref:uncharacterized protein LOC126848022 n=1 Tax=Adelges cooleyi TaxID=133065 RepID=UPI00217F8D61|nr:uncharacterized protein LOC126848022 [Adelges cooleyi]